MVVRKLQALRQDHTVFSLRPIRVWNVAVDVPQGHVSERLLPLGSQVVRLEAPIVSGQVLVAGVSTLLWNLQTPGCDVEHGHSAKRDLLLDAIGSCRELLISHIRKHVGRIELGLSKLFAGPLVLLRTHSNLRN